MDYRALSQTDLATEAFPAVQYDFRIFIAEAAFDQICNNADNTREVGGILVGDALRDENGPYVRVDNIIEALHAEESGTELTITHATWNHIHEQMDSTHKGKRILGWYHTHPNFGIFLSERDQFIQQSFFNLPFQIALVYDPVRRVHGVFSWRDSKPWRVRQYWIGNRQHLWDEAREASEPQEEKVVKKERATKAEPQRDPAPAVVTEVLGSTWIVGAVLFGLLLGFIGGWVWKGRSDDTARAAREAVSSLNTDLLAVVRSGVSDESLGRTFDEGVTKLNSASQSLKPLEGNEPVKSALQAITETQASLDRARRDRVIAREMLKQLDEVIRTNRTPEFVSRDLAAQRALFGNVYVELAREAARNKDTARVAELLKRAAGVDPDRKADYEQQLKGFEQQGVLP
jgi:proteasome lid subunit RPN8/RPN11